MAKMQLSMLKLQKFIACNWFLRDNCLSARNAPHLSTRRKSWQTETGLLQHSGRMRLGGFHCTVSPPDPIAGFCQEPSLMRLEKE